MVIVMEVRLQKEVESQSQVNSSKTQKSCHRSELVFKQGRTLRIRTRSTIPHASEGFDYWGLGVVERRDPWGGEAVVSPPSVADGVIYSADKGGTVAALSMEDGERLWEFSAKHQIWAAAHVVDGTVVIGSKDGFLYAFE